jgi:hypothetical protein
MEIQRRRYSRCQGLGFIWPSGGQNRKRGCVVRHYIFDLGDKIVVADRDELDTAYEKPWTIKTYTENGVESARVDFEAQMWNAVDCETNSDWAYVRYRQHVAKIKKEIK